MIFLAKDCAHGCYKAHPYCEPCGKSDYSWNYLIDELKESAGQWLSREAVIMYWSGDKNFQKIGQDCNPTSTISSLPPSDPTRSTTIETTEGQIFSTFKTFCQYIINDQLTTCFDQFFHQFFHHEMERCYLH